MTRQRNRRGEGDLLRGELVEAATRLLAATGDAEALTLRAVAREAGIAAPSIYRHFADRDALVREVVDACFERLDDALTAAMAAEPGAELRACCLAYCRFGLDNPGLYGILFSANLALICPSEEGPKVFGRLAALMDSHQAAAGLWASLHGIVSLRVNRPGFPWPPVEELVEAALR
ncbi:MAG: TetR/AcrR family transcriptional regulator [Nonomuraea sp.]|nr:TetR/AcrR family transcriptional regulator [Nonomuraea sp.]